MTNPGGRVRTSFLVTRTIGSKMLSYETSLISDRLCQQFYRFYVKSFFKATLTKSCPDRVFFVICFARCFVQSYLFFSIYIKVLVIHTYMRIKICLPTNTFISAFISANFYFFRLYSHKLDFNIFVIKNILFF